MAGVVQWTVTQFWNQLQALKSQLDAAQARLDANKSTLTALYSSARKEPEPHGSRDRALLEPLIHRNSELRLSYLKPIRDKFVQAVNLAAGPLRAAGYSVPQLSGLGVVPAAVIPAAAIALVITALSAVLIVNRLTEAQIQRTGIVKGIMADVTTTPAEKLALLEAQRDQLKEESKLGLLGDTSWIVPALGLLAAIMLGPQLLAAFRSRGASS